MTAKLHRHDDAETAIMAAEKVLPHLGALQQQVLDAYREFGPMTDGEAERLPRFDHLGYSTVRKRASELRQIGWLRPTGERRGGMRVCFAVPPEDFIERKRAEARGERLLF